MARKKDKLTKLDKYLLSIEWRQIYINGEATKYWVSNQGEVKNSDTGKYLTSFSKFNGDYLRINLTHKGKTYSKLVHRLVAEAFIPNPENKPQVNHIDGNKTNPKVSNLEWVTISENLKHAIKNGLMIPKTGIDHPNNKYDEATIHTICKLLEELKQPKEISIILNIPESLVNHIKERKIWLNISKEYNIPLPNQIAKGQRLQPEVSKLYSPELLHNICKSLEDGIPNIEISKKFNVPSMLVSDIKGHRCWTSYSKYYNIPYKNNTHNKVRHNVNPIYNDAISVLKEYDRSNYTDILKLLGLSDTVANRRYLAKLRYRIRSQQQSSTTIETTETMGKS